MRVAPCLVLLVSLGTPALADLDAVPTASGLARIEGDPFESGERLMIGSHVALEDPTSPWLWIEEELGDLLLVGTSEGGSACAAQWVWIHTENSEFRRSEPFGTCSDLATVTADETTVTVSMPSYDASQPMIDFVYDGATVREIPRGQEPSGAPPEAGADAWIGRHPFDLFRSSDWRDPLVALMGEKGYAVAQESIVSASRMEVHGDWVAGEGCMAHACGEAWGAVAIIRGDGRLLVALDRWDEAPPQLWGDPGGPMPAPIAQVMAGQE